MRPYVEQYHVTFPVAVDMADVFGAAFGLKAVPATCFIDEVGIVRLAGGGPTPQLLQQIDQLLNEPMIGVRATQPQLPAALSRQELERRIAADAADWQARVALARLLDAEGRRIEAIAQLQEAARRQPRNAAIQFVWGMVLLNQKQKEAALARLKQARDLDPQNWRIRKQIWALERPEKFYTARQPDYAWQKEELAREQGEAKQAKPANGRE